jgi:hypothetical protein
MKKNLVALSVAAAIMRTPLANMADKGAAHEALNKGNPEKPEPDKPKHKYGEAFMLMWYACKSCGMRECIWNSRDGVTPLTFACPCCGQSAEHVNWKDDFYAPEHIPHFGQRIWVDMTKDRALFIAKAQAAGSRRSLSATEINAMAEQMLHNGEAPDLRIIGYTQDEAYVIERIKARS